MYRKKSLISQHEFMSCSTYDLPGYMQIQSKLMRNLQHRAFPAAQYSAQSSKVAHVVEKNDSTSWRLVRKPKVWGLSTGDNEDGTDAS